MIYYKETTTRDHRPLILKHAVGADAKSYLEYFCTAHGQTDFLTTYPDENQYDPESMATQLDETAASASDTEICAFVGGKLVGSAGISMVRNRDKTRHRAEFGISILREYWGLGIGSALTAACIEAAKQAGYLQLELEVVSENERAIRLYQKFGFVPFGRNPRAFRTRDGRWQELVLMRLEL